MAAPYSISSPKAWSGQSSRQPLNPPTHPPSCGPALPTTAAAFGLPPSTASPAPITPISYVPETPAAPPTHSLASTASAAKVYPFLKRVDIADPLVIPTIAGLVPEEWASFKKQVLNYNLSIDLYKSDLDWKKDHWHMAEPSDLDLLAEYHLRIGRANQRVGAVALMECNIGQYIRAMGADLVAKQAQIDGLALHADDIEWHLTQGAKEPAQLLLDENVPQEDLAPSLFLPLLQATPSPAVLWLPQVTPASSLTLLPDSTSIKSASPVISELAMPLTHTLDQMGDAQHTPKATPMEISLPASSKQLPVSTTSGSDRLAPVIGTMVPDAQMTAAQKARIDKVLLEYKQQEQLALKELHAMHQRSHAAEVALQLEQAKLRKAELQAQLSQSKVTALLNGSQCHQR